MMLQSLSLPDADSESDSVVLLTTGLSGDNRHQVTQLIADLGWRLTDDFSSEGDGSC